MSIRVRSSTQTIRVDPASGAVSVVLSGPQGPAGEGTTGIDADDVTFSPTGTIAATDVQAAVAEVASEAASALTAHTGDTSDAHAASAIGFTPASGIAATNVQDAIVEAKTDAATYTDTQIASTISTAFDFKASVRAATTANITLSGAQTIDGVSIIAGDRVLVKNQSTGSQNGIYVAASGSWSRATDADGSGEITSGMAVPVEEGTANAGRLYMLTTAGTITIGSTSLTFTRVDAGSASAASPTFTGTVTLPTGLTGVLRADTGVVSVDSDVTDVVAAASESAAGKIEIATEAEVLAGTDTARSVVPATLKAATDVINAAFKAFGFGLIWFDGSYDARTTLFPAGGGHVIYANMTNTDVPADFESGQDILARPVVP